MRRVIVIVLIANLVGLGWGASVSVVEAQATGSISGTAVLGPCGADPEDYDAVSAADRPALENHTLLLRNVETGQIVDVTTTNAEGEFSFTGLNPATYVIEVADGVVLVVSIPIPLTTAGTISDVLVIVPDDDCPPFLLTALGLGLLAAIGAGITAGVIIPGGQIAQIASASQ